MAHRIAARRVASASLTVATTESCHRIASHRLPRAQCKQTDEWGNRLARRRQRCSSVTTLRMSLLEIPISIAQPIPIAQHSKAQQRQSICCLLCLVHVCVCVCQVCMCVCVCLRVAASCRFLLPINEKEEISPSLLAPAALLAAVARRRRCDAAHAKCFATRKQVDAAFGANPRRGPDAFSSTSLFRFAIVCAFASSCATQHKTTRQQDNNNYNTNNNNKSNAR